MIRRSLYLVSLTVLGFALEPVQKVELTGALGINERRGSAWMYIPEEIPDSTADIWIHFHGNAATVAKSWDRLGQSRILVVLHYGGLSSIYAAPFERHGTFQTILRTVADSLSTRNIYLDPKGLDIWMTSFSAGYGAVRELLKDENTFQRISLLLLADGLHASLKQGELRQQMKDFVRFANSAIRSERTFLITHSAIDPKTYASTTMTADYILQAVELLREEARGSDVIGLPSSEVIQGRFIVLGYYGSTKNEHIRHLQGLWHPLLLARTLELED